MADQEKTTGANPWTKLPVNKPLLPSHFSLLPTVKTTVQAENNAASTTGLAFYQTSGLVKNSSLDYLVNSEQAATTKEAGMSISREEIDAKLQLNEARLDTKVAQIDGKIDRLTDLITNLRADIDRQASVSARDFSEVKEQLKTSRGDNRFTRWTIVVTAVTSVIAVVGLVLGVVLGVQSSLLSAFQTGIATKSVTTEQSVAPQAN